MTTCIPRSIIKLFSIAVATTTSIAWAAGDRTPDSGPPIISWRPPAFYTSPSSGRTALTDVSGPVPFVPVTPCRQYDSRSTTALADNTLRTVTLSGAPCGILATAVAVAVNITIFNISGAGSNGVFKVGTVSPPTTAWINYPPTETQRGNAGVLSTTGAAAIVVQVNQGAGSVDFVIDVNGYYTSTLNSSEQLLITANTGAGAIRGVNASGDGVQGETASGGSSGVYGKNTGGGKGVFGVSTIGSGVGGQSTSGPGVGGVSSTGSGVYGTTAGTSGVSGAAGVWGDSHDYFGVWGSSVAGDGVHGQTTVGTASGVAGFNSSNGAGTFGSSAQGDGVFGSGLTGVHGTSQFGWGVFGHSATQDGVHGDTPSNLSAGVAGINTANGFGVYGSTNDGNGVYGTAVGSSQSANGVHAVGTSYVSCVPFCGSPSTVGSLSLLAEGNAHFNDWVTIYGGLSVVTNKNFVTPHPSDPTKQIAFVSLEGPESGTYFRGTGHLVAGYAEILVPESFRLVTSGQGLTAVATPTGSAASIYCVSKSLDKIVFQGSVDVDFDYMVNGVRAGFESYDAIQNNVAFVPRSASDKNLTHLTGETARRLKANGILNDDGTLNLDTARKLGWDQRPGWNRVSPDPLDRTRQVPASN
ncbi:MAG: hypothetical protein ACHQJD_00735 [Thermoanaerobaculia bacterium]